MSIFKDSSSVNNFATWAMYVNDVTGGWFWTIILIGSFIILFIKLTYGNFADEPVKGFAGAAFITALLATLGRFALIIPDRVVFITYIMLGVAIIILFFNRSD